MNFAQIIKKARSRSANRFANLLIESDLELNLTWDELNATSCWLCDNRPRRLHRDLKNSMEE